MFQIRYPVAVSLFTEKWTAWFYSIPGEIFLPFFYILNHLTSKDNAHVCMPVFKAASKFGSEEPGYHPQGAWALRHQEPLDPQLEINSYIILGKLGNIHVWRPIHVRILIIFWSLEGHQEGPGHVENNMLFDLKEEVVGTYFIPYEIGSWRNNKKLPFITEILHISLDVTI